MRERMVDPPPREQFILFLGHNNFAYGFRSFSMYYSHYSSITMMYIQLYYVSVSAGLGEWGEGKAAGKREQ
jgi:hypothetical protein